MAIRVNDANSDYIHIALKCAYAHFQGLKTGIAIPGIGRQDVLRLSMVIPPLAEQKRIVAKVDELMGLCDRLEALESERQTRHAALSRAALARFADAPTRTNLQFLFHNSFDVDSSELRKVILTFAWRTGLTHENTEKECEPIDFALAEPTFNGVSKGPTTDKSKTEVLRISAGTSRSDFTVNEDDFKHVDITTAEIDKCRLKHGDLLACRFNGNLHFVGRFSVYMGDSGRTQVNPDKLIRFRVNTENHLPRYVCYIMNAPPVRASIESLCATTAGNIGLSASKLRTIKIPLPPLAEQKRIVAKVDELMALVDTLEKQLAHSRTLGQQLLQSVVAELTKAQG
jgi:type I restriction enzyme S subunit